MNANLTSGAARFGWYLLVGEDAEEDRDFVVRLEKGSLTRVGEAWQPLCRLDVPEQERTIALNLDVAQIDKGQPIPPLGDILEYCRFHEFSLPLSPAQLPAHGRLKLSTAASVVTVRPYMAVVELYFQKEWTCSLQLLIEDWMKLRLITASAAEIGPLFRELAAIYPNDAPEMLADGLTLQDEQPIRDVIPFLSIDELALLLEHDDRRVREVAIQALGRAHQRNAGEDAT